MTESEMIQGYFDGMKSSRKELPDFNFSAAYKHGWMNGRDDRMKKPRDRAEVLRRRAEMILGQEGKSQ